MTDHSITTTAARSQDQKTVVIVEQPFQTQPYLWQNPVIVSAIIILLGTAATLWLNWRIQKKRNQFEEGLEQKKFENAVALEQQKIRHQQLQIKWQLKSSFAEDALAKFYETKMQFRSIRSPATWGSENEDRVGRDTESDIERGLKDRWYPYAKRLDNSSEFFQAFYATRYRSIALFGVESETPFADMWSILNEIRVAVHMLLIQNPHSTPYDSDFHDNLTYTVWETLSERDILSSNIDAVILKAEEIFRPIIVGLPEA